MNSSNSTEKYQGRIYEAKDNFIIETRISEGHASLHNPSDFIDSKLAEFKEKNVAVEITIKIVELANPSE